MTGSGLTWASGSSCLYARYTGGGGRRLVRAEATDRSADTFLGIAFEIRYRRSRAKGSRSAVEISVNPLMVLSSVKRS